MKKKLKVTMDAHVYDSIEATIGSRKPESGGILGGDMNENPLHINRYHDLRPALKGRHSGSSGVHFSPDHNEMNHVIDNIWEPKGLYLNGVIHSHPGNMNYPSIGVTGSNDGDIAYLSNLLDHNDCKKHGVETLIAPIVTFNHSGKMQITVWTLSRGKLKPREVPLFIVHKDKQFSVLEYNAVTKREIKPIPIKKIPPKSHSLPIATKPRISIQVKI